MVSRQANAPDAGSETGSWLLVGLGNPGSEYDLTRHNLGFMLIDLLAMRFDARIKRIECRSLIGRAIFENQQIEMAKPQTYMNLSGEAVNCLVKKDGRSLKQSIVVVDDLAIPFGSIRLRAKGSAGGHNGLKSIISNCKSPEFIRLRIGIKPDHPVHNPKKFVLDRFSRQELKTVESVLEKSADAINVVIKEGIEMAMSEFN